MTDEVVDQAAIEQQAQDDFAAGFNGDAPAEQAEVTPDVKPVEEAKVDEVDEPVLAGLTESQVKSLLERSARVDGLEEQIRKANGKIGEMNGYLQELRKPKEPTHEAPAPVDDAELAELETDFPEISRLIAVRARQIAQEMIGQGEKPDVQAIREGVGNELRLEMQMQLLDMQHDDWREVVATDEFGMWLATQPEETRKTYNETASAKEYGKIVTDYKQWSANTATRSQRNKQRLESAITPSGVPARTPPTKSDEDEFRAGFYGTER